MDRTLPPRYGTCELIGGSLHRRRFPVAVSGFGAIHDPGRHSFPTPPTERGLAEGAPAVAFRPPIRDVPRLRELPCHVCRFLGPVAGSAWPDERPPPAAGMGQQPFPTPCLQSSAGVR